MYHYVRPIPGLSGLYLKGRVPEEFGAQLDYIDRHYNVCSFKKVIAAVNGEAMLPARPCLLTFDDGLLDHHDYVLPQLLSRGMTGCFYVCAAPITEQLVLDVHKIHVILASRIPPSRLVDEIFGMIDNARPLFDLPTNQELYRKLATDGRFDPPDVLFVKRCLQRELPRILRGQIAASLFRKYVTRDEADFAAGYYMSLGQVRGLIDAGMEIGGHGVVHDWIGAKAGESLRRTLRDSLAFLTLVFGERPAQWLMSYPYGSYNQGAVATLRELDCGAAVTDRLGLADGLDRMLELPRLDTNDLPIGADAPVSSWTEAAIGVRTASNVKTRVG
jgi:peptidoglycan/xylan/chitin deacetylase (PgdA/CDA1 family)